MDDASTKLDQFLSLSASLLGVNIIDLRPRNTPLDIGKDYLTALQSGTSEDAVTSLCSTYAAKLALVGPDEAAGQILADPLMGPIARSILKLWLLSTWYDPSKPDQPSSVISSQAYKEGFIWKVMQSHPMGYSMWTFGYWAQDPPSRKDFISALPE